MSSIFFKKNLSLPYRKLEGFSLILELYRR
nr:MAG TPA: hypothetical protein [Caudoviricetes sp.]